MEMHERVEAIIKATLAQCVASEALHPYKNMYDPTLCNTMSMVGDERTVMKSGYYRRYHSN